MKLGVFSNKKSQSTPLSPATHLIVIILLSLALLLVIYFAFREKLGEILTSNFLK